MLNRRHKFKTHLLPNYFSILQYHENRQRYRSNYAVGGRIKCTVGLYQILLNNYLLVSFEEFGFFFFKKKSVKNITCTRQMDGPPVVLRFEVPVKPVLCISLGNPHVTYKCWGGCWQDNNDMSNHHPCFVYLDLNRQ